jgi:hypothetical protein
MILKFDWLLYIGFWCVAQSQTWGPTTAAPSAAFLPPTTPALSPNYYLSSPTMTAALADTRMESTAYYGNVKTIASQNVNGAIQILYEYYTAATAGAAASYSIGQILVPKVTGACDNFCLLGYAIDAGESLSTKDILISGATDWNSYQGAAFIFKDVGFRFSQQAQLYARDDLPMIYLAIQLVLKNSILAELSLVHQVMTTRDLAPGQYTSLRARPQLSTGQKHRSS